MILYGSTTSPYVRRLRLWLADDPYEFVKLDIFSDEGRAILKSKNPALKIPMLSDGDSTIYDSRIIFRYLSEKLGREPISWAAENTLTLIDAANDSFVELFLLSVSGLETSNSDLKFVKLQQERTQDVMALLEIQAKQGDFGQWDYPAICLYSLLDWAEFRALVDLSQYPSLSAFKQEHANKVEVINTDPRI